MDARTLAGEALKANPMVFCEADLEKRLEDPEADMTFAELGLDSLGYMELSIWLELELGVEVTEVEIQEMASLNGLADFLSRRLQPGSTIRPTRTAPTG
jgi:acyl carrier protein